MPRPFRLSHSSRWSSGQWKEIVPNNRINWGYSIYSPRHFFQQYNIHFPATCDFCQHQTSKPTQKQNNFRKKMKTKKHLLNKEQAMYTFCCLFVGSSNLSSSQTIWMGPIMFGFQLLVVLFKKRSRITTLNKWKNPTSSPYKIQQDWGKTDWCTWQAVLTPSKTTGSWHEYSPETNESAKKHDNITSIARKASPNHETILSKIEMCFVFSLVPPTSSHGQQTPSGNSCFSQNELTLLKTIENQTAHSNTLSSLV